MLDKSALALNADQVRRVCSVDHFEFETTAEVDPLVTIIGQPRGIRAIEFGIDIKMPGFNVFALGPTGTGRKTAIRSFLERHAQGSSAPQDWVYVHNFEVEHQPPLRRRIAAEIRQVRIAADLGIDAGHRRPGQIVRHDPRAAPVEGER